MNTTTAIAPFAKPFYIMAKPAGANCNLQCGYCYYLEKSKYYPGKNQMSEIMLEKFIKNYIESQSSSAVLFTWHGGEPLVLPLTFYKKAIELQKRYAWNIIINNCLQTNGTLLTDEWCKFLKENNFLVGISIDGPQEFHDEFRKMKQGKPTFAQVMRAIDLLNQYGVEWNAMAVINDFNAGYPKDFYRFFKEINCRFIQFTPIVERVFNGETQKFEVADYAVSPKQWGDFICGVFDEWIKRDVGKIFVQLFDATLANWVGEKPGVCSLAPTCGHAGVIEANGDVYSCDHFVFPENLLGNIEQQTLLEMMDSKKQKKFGRAKYENLPQQCHECRYLFACNGECPKNRFVETPNNTTVENFRPLLNYLCSGYYQFFEHVAPAMDFMKNEWLNQRSPANVMYIKK